MITDRPENTLDKKIDKLKDTIKQASDIIEQANKEIQGLKEPKEPKRWGAKVGLFEAYYHTIDDCGNIIIVAESGRFIDESRHNMGNYFKTIEDAKASNIYFALNDEYEYWHIGMPKPKTVPDGLEMYSLIMFGWNVLEGNPSWDGVLYRWPKHPRRSV